MCVCGRKKKKKLAERWHHCPCGALAQRDLFSAYLASHVNKDTLDISQAKKAWVAAQPLLQRAMSKLNQQAIGKSRLASPCRAQKEKERKEAKRKLLVLGLFALKRGERKPFFWGSFSPGELNP